MPEMTDKIAADKEAIINDILSGLEIGSSLDALVQIANDYKAGKHKQVWPSGFSNLDNLLDGGFHESQLTVVGAISSLGKTTWVLQIASQLAEQGHDVLIFSLEMSKDELNAKTVSRYTYICDKANEQDVLDRPFYQTEEYTDRRLTTFDILKGHVGTNEPVVFDNYQRAIERVRKLAEHTYIYVGNNTENVDKIREVTEQFISATGKRPLVILDYLQILTPSKNSLANHFDTRRSTNDDITSLKVLARENKIPVVVISAFNRAAYTDPVTFSSFKESGAIEYSSDILLGLQYYGMEYEKYDYKGKNDEDNHVVGVETNVAHTVRVNKLIDAMQAEGAAGRAQMIELKILKNRNGPKGYCYFQFTPKYNYFEEFSESKCKSETKSIVEAFKSSEKKSRQKEPSAKARAEEETLQL